MHLIKLKEIAAYIQAIANTIAYLCEMEQTLTHDLLNKLMNDGFTILFAAGQNIRQACTFAPISVEVDDFVKLTVHPDYQLDAFLVIEDALGMEEQVLSKHKVIIA